MRRIPSALIPLAACALASSGCFGLFQPAKPEPPLSQDCATDLGNYESPSAVLQTLSAAMNRKIRGHCAYIAAFADSASEGVAYHATFPAELIEQRRDLGGVPVWTRATEGVFYDDFMELSDGTYSLTWSDYQEAGSDVGDANDSTLFRRYTVTPSGGAEILAAGVVELKFRRLPSGTQGTADTWVVVRWIDGVDSNRLDPAHGVDQGTLLDWTISQRRLEAYDANF